MMGERTLWSLGMCAAIGALLAACQLNDTDSAPPAPSEPNTSAAQAGAGGGAGEQSDDDEQSEDEMSDAGSEDGGAEDAAPPPANLDSDAGVPTFPGLDAGNVPPTLTFDASALIPVFDASVIPGPLQLPDGSGIGPIDAGLALLD